MQSFDNESHQIVLSEDGSYTAYSKEYNEHYHSTKDGALHESLTKHVVPALTLKKDLAEVTILDICFGLGFNTLSTLYYASQHLMTSKLNIYSPELDASLVESLKNFTYPKEFSFLLDIVTSLVDTGFYEGDDLYIELFVGDAREYIKTLQTQTFDIVYQDAFSPSVNPILWTKEYFSDIRKLMKEDAILTTYSTALATRLALYENGFNLYINSGEDYRNATLASPSKIKGFKEVEMEHKIACNPEATSLRD